MLNNLTADLAVNQGCRKVFQFNHQGQEKVLFGRFVKGGLTLQAQMSIISESNV